MRFIVILLSFFFSGINVFANNPEYYVELVNPKFEKDVISFDVKITSINNSIRMLSGNFRYNFSNERLSSNSLPVFFPSIHSLEFDAVSFLGTYPNRYVNIGFSTPDLNGIEISDKGVIIGKVFHKVERGLTKNMQDLVKPRVFNVGGYENHKPNATRQNCTKLFTVTSPFEPIQEGKPENKVQIHSDMNISTSDIDVYPNPTTNLLYYQIGSETRVEVEEISMLDAQGRVVMRLIEPGKQEGTIDMTNVAPGMFYLMVKQGETISRHKIIKI